MNGVIFSGCSRIEALSNGDNGDNPLQIVIEPSELPQDENKESSSREIDMDELFGSEQVFPFEAGFGKNSGKS